MEDNLRGMTYSSFSGKVFFRTASLLLYEKDYCNECWLKLIHDRRLALRARVTSTLLKLLIRSCKVKIMHTK